MLELRRNLPSGLKDDSVMAPMHVDRGNQLATGEKIS
jgi:hypothetical protein